MILIADTEIEGGERTKLLDFGIAKLLGPLQGDSPAGSGAQRTRDGVLLGTPRYMSPEQCRGAQTLDGKSDVYSLAVLMYQMLAGQTPFVAPEGDLGVLAMHLVDPVPPLRDRAPGTGPGLTVLIERMLAKAPADRPTMSEVAAELAVLAASSPLGSSPHNSTTLRGVSGQLSSSHSGSRRSLLVAVGLLALLALGTLALWPRSAPQPLPARPALSSIPKELPVPALAPEPPPTAIKPAILAAPAAAAVVTDPETASAAPPPSPAPPPKPPASRVTKSSRAVGASASTKTVRPGKRRPSRLVD